MDLDLTNLFTDTRPSQRIGPLVVYRQFNKRDEEAE